MSQWKVPDVNDANGEGEYNVIIPRTKGLEICYLEGRQTKML